MCRPRASTPSRRSVPFLFCSPGGSRESGKKKDHFTPVGRYCWQLTASASAWTISTRPAVMLLVCYLNRTWHPGGILKMSRTVTKHTDQGSNHPKHISVSSRLILPPWNNLILKIKKLGFSPKVSLSFFWNNSSKPKWRSREPDCSSFDEFISGEQNF